MPGGSVVYGEDGRRVDWAQASRCPVRQPHAALCRHTRNVRVQQRMVGQGRWAARFDLLSTRRKQRPATSSTTGHSTLAESTTTHRSFLPSHLEEPSDRARSFWAWRLVNSTYQLITGAPVGLATHRNHVNLTVRSGYFDGYATRWHSRNGIALGNLPRMYAIPRPLKLGSWHQPIVHVRWSAGNYGAVDVWHGVRSKRHWKQSVRLRGKPTVQWSARSQR
jgi:hypothetical protein